MGETRGLETPRITADLPTKSLWCTETPARWRPAGLETESSPLSTVDVFYEEPDGRGHRDVIVCILDRPRREQQFREATTSDEERVVTDVDDEMGLSHE